MLLLGLQLFDLRLCRISENNHLVDGLVKLVLLGLLHFPHHLSLFPLLLQYLLSAPKLGPQFLIFTGQNFSFPVLRLLKLL